ncbi:phospho-N-acetylmuramoyl-pentapeptide-transferase [Candidatus Uhrbacteria bacterium]|nr:phospho-N-acetylmuramoyl-pentapeptide-transferase [Candidatus Uhrbacteria bacterium]
MPNFVIFKITVLTTIAFLWAWMWTPILYRFLIRYSLVKQIRDEASAPIFFALHKNKAGTPTMGGLLIWMTTFLFALFFYYLSLVLDNQFFVQLNFLTRAQVLLPLGALVASALVGLVDDFLNIKKIGPLGGGLRMRHRFILYTCIALVGAWWFYAKLDWDILHVPFVGDFAVGWWYVPFFMVVIIATAFSVNEIDGLDGLAGGTLLAAFASYGAIAFIEGKYDLATFCGVIIGALLAFLWFNIYPAKFMMGDTGAMSLGVTLGIVAMLTNYALLLPVIGFLFVIEAGSVIVQVVSKKIGTGKMFLSTPYHHHLEARGWKEPTIVMRFWVISGILAVIGLIIVLVERGLY